MTYIEQNEWAENRGLRSTNTDVCLALVAGVHCERHQTYHGACPSTTGLVGPLHFDHTRMWYRPNSGVSKFDREYVVTTEPYNLEYDDDAAREYLNEVQTAVTPLGLRVEISRNSPWYQGYTMMVIFTRVRDGEDQSVSGYAERHSNDSW